MTITIEKLKYLIKDNLKDNNHKDTILEQLDFLFKEKKYTEEDLLKFTEWVETSQEASDYDKKNRMRFAPKMEGNSEVKKRLPELYSLYTQSLQPKTEWEVEIVDGKLKLK